MPRRKSKRLLEHSGTLPFSEGSGKSGSSVFQPSGTFGPDPRQPGRPNWMRQTAMPPSVADHSSWRPSATGLRWASQQSSGFDWDLGSGALQPSTQEYDGFYRLKADTGRGSPPGQEGGGPPRKAARPCRIPAFRRRSGCILALSSAEARRSLYPAVARAQRRHDITAW
jgi:hypothetical protein